MAIFNSYVKLPEGMFDSNLGSPYRAITGLGSVLAICLSQHHLGVSENVGSIHLKGNFNREHDDTPWDFFEVFAWNFRAKPSGSCCGSFGRTRSSQAGSRPLFAPQSSSLDTLEIPNIFFLKGGFNWLLLNGSQRASSSFFLLSTSFMKDVILSSWPMVRPIQLEGWFPSKICQHNSLSLWFALNKTTSTRWRCIS